MCPEFLRSAARKTVVDSIALLDKKERSSLLRLRKPYKPPPAANTHSAEKLCNPQRRRTPAHLETNTKKKSKQRKTPTPSLRRHKSKAASQVQGGVTASAIKIDTRNKKAVTKDDCPLNNKAEGSLEAHNPETKSMTVSFGWIHVWSEGGAMLSHTYLSRVKSHRSLQPLELLWRKDVLLNGFVKRDQRFFFHLHF